MEVPNHVSTNQFGDLPMFLSAGELQNYVTHSIDSLKRSGEADNELWDYKEKESRAAVRHLHTLGDDIQVPDPPGSGVYESISQNGFNWKRPVTVSHRDGQKVMTDGHHRLAAASALERETGKPVWVPIHHMFGYPSIPSKPPAEGI